MKNIFLLFTLFAFSFVSFAQEEVADPNAPVFKFQEEEIDYGTIENGADGTRVFKFTNEGKSPLIISKVSSTCGCTVPSWPKEPIMPGTEGEIKVKYDTKRTGTLRKTITILSNASEPRKLLKIKGQILPPKKG